MQLSSLNELRLSKGLLTIHMLGVTALEGLMNTINQLYMTRSPTLPEPLESNG